MLEQALAMTPASGRSPGCACWRASAARSTTRRGASGWQSSRAEATALAAELETPRRERSRGRPPAGVLGSGVSRAAAVGLDRAADARARGGRPGAQLQGHAWLVVDLLEHGDSDAVDAQIEAFTGARSSCASRCTCGTPPSGGRCGRCSRVSSRGRPARRRGAGNGSRRGGDRAAVLRDAAARDPARAGADGRARAAGREMVGSIRPPGVARGAGDAAMGDRAHRGGAGGVRMIAAQASPTSRGRRLADRDDVAGRLRRELGDAERAAQLYELLAPYREVNVVIGWGPSAWARPRATWGGSPPRWAARSRRPEHFERALVANAAPEGAGVSRPHAAGLRAAARARRPRAPELSRRRRGRRRS